MSEKEDEPLAEDKLGVAVDAVLRTPEGRTVFAYIMHLCGWLQADVPVDALQQVNTSALAHNATRRFIYQKLRSRATLELLHPVEQEAELAVREAVEKSKSKEKV